jgi:hypothetical protein
MKILRKLFANPIAIAVVAVHWLVFIFSIFYERHLIFSEGISMHGPEPILFNFLLFLNIPAVSVMEFTVLPVLSSFEKNLMMEIIGSLIFVIFSSLQWLCLGHLTAAVVEIYKPKEVKLLLK